MNSENTAIIFEQETVLKKFNGNILSDSIPVEVHVVKHIGEKMTSHEIITDSEKLKEFRNGLD